MLPPLPTVKAPATPPLTVTVVAAPAPNTPSTSIFATLRPVPSRLSVCVTPLVGITT